MIVKIAPRRKPFSGRIEIPPDKSLTHRAFMLSAVAEGVCEVTNPLDSKDCLATRRCLELCGIRFEKIGEGFKISGEIEEPPDVLFAANSGTTARILTGLLSGYPIYFTVSGDESLKQRPMKRITAPLKEMGATIIGRKEEGFLPISVKGGNLKAISTSLPVASAQVKSAIIFAALRAEGKTEIQEPHRTRDHTERLLNALGAHIEVKGRLVKVGPSKIPPFSFKVPADPSSCAFFAAAAMVTEGSHIVMEEVLLNPTRIEFLKVFREMGAEIHWEEREKRLGEPVGVVEVKHSPHLKGITLSGERIPLVIDEIPIIAMVATQAEGRTVIKDAKELRVKESDRIAATVRELKRMGAEVEELEDGLIIEGPAKLKGTRVFSHRDHRIAMMLAVAGLIAEGETEIEEGEWVDISFPHFFKMITR
ncbi:MAG: 3-phosphoshikimate 1-carboxyvinyltransferase [Deferribacteres bacterium]|nr:3-phosphoshikimate 1-carboxyvinyltransferase [Deferribacteres bacterium]